MSNFNTFKTPLRSSGIHFKVENAWKNNMTFDKKDGLKKEFIPERFSTPRSKSRSLSLRK